MLPFLGGLLSALLLLSLLSTLYLYSYPVFHGCAFPKHHSPANSTGSWALDPPFRLLALGDPQLEGDSSLESLTDGYFPTLKILRANFTTSSSLRDRLLLIPHSLRELIVSDLPRIGRSYRKRLDLWGNDYYLAHIYRTVFWFTKPTHVTVLGDLLGSQWVSDEEFERRGSRYWSRVFKNGQRVDDNMTNDRHVDILGRDKSWETRVINIVGNHDVGYAGDMTEDRLQRFERIFGKANWETRFVYPEAHYREVSDLESAGLPELRIVVLNSLNLDTPALSTELQGETYQFVNDVIGTSRPVEDRTTATIVLTHLPLHKQAGVCVDSPYFDFHSEDHGGGVKEQNHLSYNAAKGILEGIFGMSGNPDGPGGGFGRNGIILTGHDHEGCDVYHYLSEDEKTDERTWKAKRWNEAGQERSNKTVPGIREITLQSMMGEFSGNAGLLSAWFDHDVGEWRTEYLACVLGKQHIWWAIHGLDIVTLVLILAIGFPIFWARRDVRGNSGKKLAAHSPRQEGRPAQDVNVKMAYRGEVLQAESVKRRRSRKR